MTAVETLEDDAIFAYASGACAGAYGVLIGTHIALKPESRRVAAAVEQMGGQAIVDMTPVALSGSARASVLAALDEPANDSPSAARTLGGDQRWPEPLRALVQQAESERGWRSAGRGAKILDLPIEDGDRRTWLISVDGGRAMPQHTHNGIEATLVVESGFSDHTGHYGMGDVAITGPELDHQPIADEGRECVCLVVTDGSLKLTGPVGRWLNPFLRF